MSSTSDKDGRDDRGRFTVGNPGGPGGARRRAFTLRRAAEEAITPEHIEALIRKATRMGLEGNLSAMRLVLDRVCGRAAEGPREAEPLGVVMPKLKSAADCNVALEKLVDAMCSGDLDRDQTDTLIKAVQTRLRAIELGELEERLAHLEEAAAQADHRARG